MTRIDAITRIAEANADSRTAQNAGSGASRVVRRAISDKPVGPAATVTLSPRAQAILAQQKEGSSAPDVTLPVVAASCALVLSKGASFFKRKGNKA